MELYPVTGLRDIVVLADAWGGSPNSAMHLFGRMALERRVFWFDMPTRLPRPAWRDVKRAGKFLFSWGSPPRPKGDGTDSSPADARKGLYVIAPAVIPWFKDPVRRLNRMSLWRTYTRLRDKHDLRDPVLVTVYPTGIDLFRRLPRHTRLYYCVDDWLELPGLATSDWAKMEEELLREVDGLIVTSRALEQKNRHHRPVLYLPHGVDFEHFSQATRRAGETTRIDSIPRPIVGFFGIIGPWVDLQLVAELARGFPEVSFVMIGGADVSLAPLEAISNVHCLGQIPYDELPSLARHFDVGLIPFTISKLTVAVNPLKLLEYYALGLPVLATRLPELEAVGGPIRLASTPAGFREALGEMLSEDRAAQAARALDIARQNTWERRVEQLIVFVDGLRRHTTVGREDESPGRSPLERPVR